ncbi:MAG TPA: hypothetical protein VGO43_00335 [Pyrinomonadaceae bacterium]|jgi:inorganic pyrophosphatase|nr:hypothetical protein [Pyrinomonadaceae bacterium]
MDFSPFATPTILLAVVSAIVGLIVKAVRLQGKVDKLSEECADAKVARAKDLADAKTSYAKDLADLKAANASDIAELQKHYDNEVKELKDDLKDTRTQLFKHTGDVQVHHNAEAVKEFREALDRRLDTFDESFKDIARKLNHMAGRE